MRRRRHPARIRGTLPDERGDTVAAFLERAVAWYGLLGITVARVMTDSGPGYRSSAHASTCRRLGLRHLRTRPYRPRTNGRAERFIQTTLHEWAYGRVYGSSEERSRALAPWLRYYNFRRRHGSLGHQPPGARLDELNNVPRNYTKAAAHGPALTPTRAGAKHPAPSWVGQRPRRTTRVASTAFAGYWSRVTRGMGTR